jgi:hypothetical protein
LRLFLFGTSLVLLSGGVAGLVVARSEALDTATGPAYVTGTVVSEARLSNGRWTEDEAMAHVRGWSWSGRVASDDPRLVGHLTYESNWDWFKPEMEQLESGTWRLTEEGAEVWRGRSTKVASDAGPLHHDTVLLAGVGANDGLTAYLLVDFRPYPKPAPFESVIVPGEMPPFPDLPAE